MKPFQIFKPGKHTSANGATLTFSEDDLKAAVAAYDPALHEAPIVIGHPKDNGPAYGWVAKLDYQDGALVAEPVQVEEQFSEMVTSGRFKKRSASFYTPDAPNNPKPGVYYLRHVGFLGAQPPAVKGLKDVAFSEAEEGVIEFGDSSRFAWSSLNQMMRSLREWIIGKDGLEIADKLLPNYYLSDLEAASKEMTDPAPTNAIPTNYEENTMTPEQIAALQAENETLKARNTELETTAANFSERETALAAREAAAAEAETKATRATIEARIDGEVKAGKVLPAKAKGLVDYAMTLTDQDASIDFGEGDKAEKVTQREFFLRSLAELPKAVDYNEHSAEDGKNKGAASDTEVVEKARAYVAKKAEQGKAISFTEAVTAVHEGLAD